MKLIALTIVLAGTSFFRQSQIDGLSECCIYRHLVRSISQDNSDDKRFTILSTTEISGFNLLSAYSRLLENEVDEELVRNFILKNAIARKVQRLPNCIPGQDHITATEIAALFEGEDGWKEFYSARKKSAGIARFSAVGFNNARDLALVHVGLHSGWRHGIGFFYLFEKTKGSWVKTREIHTWDI